MPCRSQIRDGIPANYEKLSETLCRIGIALSLTIFLLWFHCVGSKSNFERKAYILILTTWFTSTQMQTAFPSSQRYSSQSNRMECLQLLQQATLFISVGLLFPYLLLKNSIRSFSILIVYMLKLV